MELVFYMRWIPDYKIKELIDSIKEKSKNENTKVSEIKEKIKQDIKNWDLNIWESTLILKRIWSINEAIKLIDKDIILFEKNLFKTDSDKEKLYEQILDYNNRIDNIEVILKKEF
jgi:hypothetical protein